MPGFGVLSLLRQPSARRWLGLRPGAGLVLTGVLAMAQAAPIGVNPDAPAPRAEPSQGGQGSQVLDRALSGDLGVAGRQSNLSLDLRRESGQAGIARAEPAPASAVRLPPPTRLAPAVAPAPTTAQVPSLLHGQLATTSNEVVARPEAPKLARDWTPGGAGDGPGGGAGPSGHGATAYDPSGASARGAATASAVPWPLAWLSQGLAFIRENRVALLAAAGALALVVMVQQARGRRRRA